MQRARPRLGAGARAHRRARCSSPAACRRATSPWSARVGVTAVTLLALAEPYRRARMLTFLDPFADPTQRRVPDLAVADRARQRRAHRRRPRRGPGQVELPPERAHRLHLRDHRRGARADRRAARDRALRRVRACSASAPRCARPTGSACCSRPASRCGSSARPSSTSARSSGCCPVTGHPAAVRVVRRLGARSSPCSPTGILANVARQGARRRRRRAARSARRDGDLDVRV